MSALELGPQNPHADSSQPIAPPERLPASPMSRAIATIAMLVVLALMITARCLEPAQSGYGTHQQLGLPPCSSVLILGMRCPACGMTTAWSHAVRGQWAQALQANAGGLALVMIALASMPVFCYYLSRGYWSRHGWFSFSLALSLAAALLIAIGQWLTRLV